MRRKNVKTVSLILIRDEKVLVEKRRKGRAVEPSKVVIPGGHVETGESSHEACKRELKEELGIDCDKFTLYDAMLVLVGSEDQQNKWFICENWEGEPQCLEAEEFFFIGSSEINKIDSEGDREVITRLFQEKRRSD